MDQPGARGGGSPQRWLGAGRRQLLAMAIQIQAIASIAADPFSFRDITQYVPFSTAPNGTSSLISIKVTVAGQGTAHLEIFDPTNSIIIQVPDASTPPGPLTIYDDVAGHARFQGYVQKIGYKVVATYRWIIIDAVDLNSVPTTTLVGVPNGEVWTGPDSAGQWLNIDPNAHTYYSDQYTIQQLFAHYWVYAYVTPN